MAIALGMGFRRMSQRVGPQIPHIHRTQIAMRTLPHNFPRPLSSTEAPSSFFFQQQKNAVVFKKIWQEKIKENPKNLKLTSSDDADCMDMLIKLIESDGINVENITLPKSGLNKLSIQRLFSAIGKSRQTLPAFGVCNPLAIFGNVNIFRKPDLEKITEMGEKLQKPFSAMWGYQMQNIPLDDPDFIDALSAHAESLCGRHLVVLTLSDKASTYY